MSISFRIVNRNQKELAVIEGKLSDNFTVGLLKGLVEKKIKLQSIRQYLTYGDEPKRIVLDDNSKPLSAYGITANATIVLKDLGPQMLWSMVFYIEYLLPMIAQFFLYSYFAPKEDGYSLIQKVGFVLGIAHFIKRELETLLVHQFSKESMPVKRAFINFFHYGVLFGTNVGVELFGFWSNPNYSNTTIGILVGLWALSEFMNLKCHVILKNLRTEGTKERKIPYGFGFNQASSANYFWEVLSWVFYSLLVRCYSAYFFLGCSTYQMLVWALEKQRRYKKEFGDKFPRSRKAMFPFII